MEIQTTGEKSHEVKSLIFSILDLLRDVGIPLDGTSRRLERMAMACLAVGGVKNSFKEVKYALDCEMQIHIIYEYIADFRWHANSVKWAGEREPPCAKESPTPPKSFCAWTQMGVSTPRCTPSRHIPPHPPSFMSLTAAAMKAWSSGPEVWRMSSCVPSHSLRPSSTKTICSPMEKTEFMSWVLMIVVIPLSWVISEISESMTPAVTGSRPELGSSQKR